MEQLSEPFISWILQYGSIVIFCMLAVGIIGLPIPDETLLITAGVLMSKGNLMIVPTLIAGYAGPICGITVNYLIGWFVGIYLFKKFGRKIGITDAKMEKMHSWFEHYGKWSLFFGYFVPGVRHFTGLSAGFTRLGYHEFALFAYSGSVAWASLFMAIGYFFGEAWSKYFKFLGRESDIIISVVILLIVFGYLIFRFKKWH